MSRALELPEPLYDALLQAAAANGTTPQEWIAAHLPPPSAEVPPEVAKSLADLFAGRVGRIRSGGKETWSESGGSKLTEYLRQKRTKGRL